VAVLAFGAIASASASAASPAFEGPFPNTFSRGITFFSLSTVGNRSVTCFSGGAGSGELTSATALAVTFPSRSCTFNSKACKTTAMELEGTLVYVNKKSLAAVVLQHKGGGTFAEITCGSEETLKLRGAVIGTMSPTNVRTTTLGQKIAQTAGVQELTEYENAKGEAVKAKLEMEGTGTVPFAYEQTGAKMSGGYAMTKETQITAVLSTRGLPEFTSASGKMNGATGGSTWGDSLGNLWEYSTGSYRMEIIDPNDVAHVWWSFTQPSAGGCHNVSSSTFETDQLKGRLGYVNKATKEVGLLLESSGPLVGECEHGASKEKFSGSVIGIITPVNTKTSIFTLKFAGAGHGTQKPEKFEGEEGLNHLEYHVSEYLPVGLSWTVPLETQTEMEIKA
jgi:hypothetical protein